MDGIDSGNRYRESKKDMVEDRRSLGACRTWVRTK
jgi:hypothetical protein